MYQFWFTSNGFKNCYSSQIFYFSLKKAGYNKNLCENIATKLDNVHNLVLKDN